MESLKKIYDKIKNKKTVLIILFIGIALLIMPTGKKEDDAPYSGKYEEMLSEETEKILGKIEGAGKVYVMISFSDRGKMFPATDKSENGNSVNEKTVSVSGKVMLVKEEYPSVRGVVVVSEGGADENVKNDIINAVSALTGAPIHNIKVFKMEG